MFVGVAPRQKSSINGKQFVCKHVPLDVVDSDEVFCVGVPVIDLLCCKVT